MKIGKYKSEHDPWGSLYFPEKKEEILELKCVLRIRERCRIYHTIMDAAALYACEKCNTLVCEECSSPNMDAEELEVHCKNCEEKL